jgi:hypothetical protein
VLLIGCAKEQGTIQWIELCHDFATMDNNKEANNNKPIGIAGYFDIDITPDPSTVLDGVKRPKAWNVFCENMVCNVLTMRFLLAWKYGGCLCKKWKLRYCHKIAISLAIVLIKSYRKYTTTTKWRPLL